MIQKILKENNYQRFETGLYLILWTLVFIAPFFLLNTDTGPRRHIQFRILHEFSRIIPYFIIFLLNNFLFFRYFQAKQYPRYFGLTLISILIVSYLATRTPFFFRFLQLPGPPMRNPRAFMNNPLSHVFYNVILSVLVVGFNNAVKISINWMEDRKNVEALEKENYKARLDYLRHQVSPHFFMNTLNNIHVLIDHDRELAKDSVIKLSKLMRVLLYESEQGTFTLKKELEFIRDYTELMRIRVDEEQVEVRLNFPADVPDVMLPPLLFISFVENAFKHGVRATGKSYIFIDYKISRNQDLLFSVKNSKRQHPSNGGHETIGIENSRKRFDLIYTNNYQLDIIDEPDSFEVRVRVPLNVD